MSTIDPTSQSQLDSILKKLGVQQEEGRLTWQQRHAGTE